LRLQKGLLLVFVLAFAAIILTACFPPSFDKPKAGDTPPITPDLAIKDTVHPIDGVFANCNDCHADVQHTSAAVDNFACVDCHTMTPEAEQMGLPAGIPHSTEGAYANCTMCHSGIEETHKVFKDYSDCLSCHEALVTGTPGGSEGSGDGPATGGGLAVLTLPANHEGNAMYENCATCHAGGAMLPAVPSHPLDGDYANCSACHTVNYKGAEAPASAPAAEAPAAEKPAEQPAAPAEEKPAASGPAALALPANHQGNAMYENCATCHAGGAMLPAVPSHPLDGAYATCSNCHTISYK